MIPNSSKKLQESIYALFFAIIFKYLQMEVLVYKRKVTIVKEHLDWEDHTDESLKKKILKGSNAVLSPAVKQNKTDLNKKSDSDKKLYAERKETTFSDKNSKLFLIFTVLVFPYIIGFLVCYFIFYYYAAVPIDHFFNMQRGYDHIELWTIGIYLFVAVGMLWIVVKSLFLKER